MNFKIWNMITVCLSLVMSDTEVKLLLNFLLCLIVLVTGRQKIDSYKIWKFQVFTSFMELLCGFK